MKKLSRKERERQNKRDLIIDSALHVMQGKGFEHVTMDEIAEAAEIGKGTLYLYFKSKTVLYLAISERGSRMLNDQLAKVLLLELPGISLIEKMGFTYLNFIRENPLYFTAFNYFEQVLNEGKMADNPIMEQCENHAVEAMTYIVRALQIGMQDGSIKKSFDPKELGIIIWGASKGVMHMAFLKNHSNHMKILNNVEFDLQSLVAGFIDLLRSGMKSD
jgi:TetR/AcrR family transcriptional regulator